MVKWHRTVSAHTRARNKELAEKLLCKIRQKPTTSLSTHKSIILSQLSTMYLILKNIKKIAKP